MCMFNPVNRCPKNTFSSTACLNTAKGSLLRFLPLVLSLVSSVAWEEDSKDEVHVVGCVSQRAVGLYY